MTLTREGLHWHRSPWDGQRVRTAVQRLRWDAGARVSPGEAERLRAERPEGTRLRFDRSTAHALYRELIAPALPSLVGKTRLFIAAGGSLAGLPFSLLVSKPPPAGPDDDPAALRATQWLADDFELTHIPSLQSLALLRQPRPAPAAGGAAFIGIGNPVLGPTAQNREYGATRGPQPDAERLFAGTPTQESSPAYLPLLRAMPSLPGTKRELEMVQASVRATSPVALTEARATEPNVRAVTYRGAALILFSTHGLTAEEATGSGEPGLVLTPPPDQGEDPSEVDPANDGYLAASEVTKLDMRDADWVVLSACNTATGENNANLSALARAFFYAGARSLLASHWPVSDDVAPALITRTVAPEQGKLTRAAALQSAMRSIRNDPGHPEWAHPFYWAPFVLIDGGTAF
jgi:CHAT domain-containing protein